MGSQAATASDVLTLDNFIGGRWVKAQTSEFFDVHNPALGDVIGRTPLSTAADVDAAVQAAARAFPAWRDTPVNARAQVLYRLKQLMEQNRSEERRVGKEGRAECAAFAKRRARARGTKVTHTA